MVLLAASIAASALVFVSLAVWFITKAPGFPGERKARTTTGSDSSSVAEELECEVDCNVQEPRAMAAVRSGDLSPPGPWNSRYVRVKVSSGYESPASNSEKRSSGKNFLGCWESRISYVANEQPLVVYELSFAKAALSHDESDTVIVTSVAPDVEGALCLRFPSSEEASLWAAKFKALLVEYRD
mmetsp:Transcript_45018/g.74945  ORF Transcript_45018/g.74945 Transcript_45018/m.74945 type:complete len:184 (-) Transcript_45018:116-667(-)